MNTHPLGTCVNYKNLGYAIKASPGPLSATSEIFMLRSPAMKPRILKSISYIGEHVDIVVQDGKIILNFRSIFRSIVKSFFMYHN